MIKPKITKSGKVEKIIKIIKNHQQYQKLPVNLQNLHDKVKNDKISKSRKNWKITPSEPSCQPEKGPLTFLKSVQKYAFERESAWSPNHITFECSQTRSACWSARSRDHFWDLFWDHFQITSECWSALSLTHSIFKCASLHLWMLISLESNSLHLQMCKDQFWVCRRSGTTSHCLWIMFECKSAQSLITSHSNMLGFASECDSPQEPNHFAFECAGIHLWMQFSPGAKSLCIQMHWDSPLNCIWMLISSGVKLISQPNV